MKETPICPDCRTRMEVGFVPDYGYGTVYQMRWNPGVPEVHKVLGLQVAEGQILVEWAAGRPIDTYRCPDCGLLRSYAM